jgi:hypothetical protein
MNCQECRIFMTWKNPREHLASGTKFCRKQGQSYAWFQASASMVVGSALFWNITQFRVVILYRRFETTYRSSWTSWPLKVGPICCPETSVKGYYSTLNNIPEEGRSQGQSSLTFYSLAVTLRTSRFNIKKFYVVPTLRLCVLYGSQNKQQLLPYKTLRDWFL